MSNISESAVAFDQKEGRNALVSALILKELKENPSLFYEFMDEFSDDEERFHRFSELLRIFIMEDEDYLDHALSLRGFLRSHIIVFAEQYAHC